MNKINKNKYVLGCDTGGTFTDFALLNRQTGKIKIYKCLTTLIDPSDAILKGILALSTMVPDFLSKCDSIIHGTTLASNAVIERNGAKTGLITTKGFKDVAEIGTELRYDVYDIYFDYPKPLIPRYLRKEVDERIYSDGRVLQRVNYDDVDKALDEFSDNAVESIAVSLLHSYINPSHEKQIEKYILEKYPKMFVSLSSDIFPKIKEYERTSTTILNAYVKPIMAGYLIRLKEKLTEIGVNSKLYIILSGGGVTSVEPAMKFPVRTIESGPAAGALASEYYGRLYSIDDLVSFDMGGTTAKECLISKGEVCKVSTFEIDRVNRFKKGSGIPIQVPVIDLVEIGAGGGSIAHIDRHGLLRVGPESAGANPGPICYSLGGKQPTVTDADLVLGYLDPDFFLGGEMQLDKERAAKAIEEQIGKPLGLHLERSAFGIYDLVNENMAAAARIYVAEKGADHSKLTLMAFGGAGPVHASAIAKKMGVSRVIVPVGAGVASSMGILFAPFSYDLERTYNGYIENIDFEKIEKIFQEMQTEGKNILLLAGRAGQIEYFRSLELRYVGQESTINIKIPNEKFTNFSEQQIVEYFNIKYINLYGRTFPNIDVEFVTLKVTAILKTERVELEKLSRKELSLSDAVKGKRKAYCPSSASYVDYTVYDRYKLFSCAKIKGPAIIEERESTAIIEKDSFLHVDEFGTLIISIK